MLFKDIKTGYPVYFLDKNDTTFYQGKVVSVAVPRYDTPQPFCQGQQNGLVVDVTIEAKGTTKTYTIPETATVTYAANLILSTDKEGLLREVEAMKSASEQALSQVDKHKSTIDKCNALLEELNPAFAEKRAQDKRIEGIENEVRNIGTMVRDLIKELKN